MSNLHVMHIEASNIKRVQFVNVSLNQGLNIVGGNNANGKTSFLDAFQIATGGKKYAPAKPIREGAESGEIRLTLADGNEVVYEVETTVTKKDGGFNTKTVLRDKNGHALGSPQKILDEIFTSLTFDPLEFANMKPKDQLETLKKVMGLDFSEIEQRIAGHKETRLLVGRERDQLKGELAGITYTPDMPEEEVSISAAIKELDEAKKLEAAKEMLTAQARGGAKLIHDLEDQINEIKRRIEEESAKVDATNAELGSLPETPDLEALTAKVDNAEATNEKVRKNQSYKRVESQLKAKTQAWDDEDAAIKALEADKENQLKAATFPVSGMAFNDEGVTFQGQPFEQASGAERLRCSVAMAIALKPKLKCCLIRDGSLLDDEGLETVRAICEDHGMQVIMERVGKGKECQIIIEDGLVEGAEVAETVAA